MHIEIAQHAGACFGVSRALDIVRKVAANAPARVYTLGPLIHNPVVISELEKEGVIALADNDLDVIRPDDTVILRTHGVTKELLEKLYTYTSNVIDATCPFVKKAQDAAKNLEENGKHVLIIGEANHPETLAIASRLARPLVLDASETQLDRFKNVELGVVAQTTRDENDVCEMLKKLRQVTSSLKFENTICSATKERQNAASELAFKVDAMVVIGGKASANTARLVKICEKQCDTFHIEDPEEVKSLNLFGYSSLGITAGASTPIAHIDAVRDTLEAGAKQHRENF